MMKKAWWVVIIVLIILIGWFVFKGKLNDTIIEETDVNGDGVISESELATGGYAELVSEEEVFSEIDDALEFIE
jgi:hypothetical protein